MFKNFYTKKDLNERTKRIKALHEIEMRCKAKNISVNDFKKIVRDVTGKDDEMSAKLLMRHVSVCDFPTKEILQILKQLEVKK